MSVINVVFWLGEGKDINFSIANTSIFYVGWLIVGHFRIFAPKWSSMHWQSSQRLEYVHYDIRGPIYLKALEMEAAGHEIIPLI